MIKRPTWVMVVVLGLIASLAYYMKTVPDNFISTAFAAPTPTAAPSFGMLIASADGPVNGINITNADGHSVSLKRETSGWTLTVDAQNPVPADQTTAEQSASQVLAQRLTADKIKSATSDLSSFGLDKPAYTYQLILANGKTVTFKIGKATITGDGYYLQKEDGTIAAVEKYTTDNLLNLLTQPPYMFPLTETPTPPAAALPTGTITPTLTATPGT